MTHIHIDKDVPMPPRTRSGGRPSKYPWQDMKIGDSFAFPVKVKNTTAASLSYRAGKQSGKTFSIRLMQEGVRCWRTA